MNALEYSVFLLSTFSVCTLIVIGVHNAGSLPMPHVVKYNAARKAVSSRQAHSASPGSQLSVSNAD